MSEGVKPLAWTLRSGSAGCTGVTLVTLVTLGSGSAGGSRRSRRAGITLVAVGSGIAGVTLVSLIALRPLRADRSYGQVPVISEVVVVVVASLARFDGQQEVALRADAGRALDHDLGGGVREDDERIGKLAEGDIQHEPEVEVLARDREGIDIAMGGVVKGDEHFRDTESPL